MVASDGIKEPHFMRLFFYGEYDLDGNLGCNLNETVNGIVVTFLSKYCL